MVDNISGKLSSFKITFLKSELLDLPFKPSSYKSYLVIGSFVFLSELSFVITPAFSKAAKIISLLTPSTPNLPSADG